MATALDVANYFLAAQDHCERDITNLKLQKLCSYAHAISLALLGKPLFDEPLQAWTLGPVIPSVYRKFAEHGGNIIPDTGLSETFAREPFDDEQKFILELTAANYGWIAPFKLSARSHLDFPGQFGSKKNIPNDGIATAFAGNPAVIKIKQLEEKFVKGEGRISEKEVFDALGA